MAIADQLTELQSVKQAIKTEIEAKGQDLTDIPFTGYAEKISDIKASDDGSGWQRPGDWIPMPTEEQIEDNEIYLLMHIPQGSTGLFAANITGTDLTCAVVQLNADGSKTILNDSLQSISSIREYRRSFDTDSWEGQATTNNGKVQLLLQIKGSTITTFNSIAYKNKVEVDIIEFIGKATRLTTISLRDYWKSLRVFSLYGNNKISNMSHSFAYCSSLSSVPALDTSNVTNMSSMFRNCSSLSSIPALDTSNVTNMGTMFYCCYSLSNISSLNTGKVTNVNSMFSDCNNLKALNLQNTKGKYYYDLSNCAFSRKALVMLFKSLSECTSTLAVSANWGFSELTDEEKAIATDKGWTLT